MSPAAQSTRKEPRDIRHHRMALAALVLGALAIGTAPILVRVAHTGPAAAGFWRLVFALPMLAVIGWRGEGTALGKPSWAMTLAGVLFALDLGCWHYGIRFTSVTNATVLANLAPVLVVLAGWLFLGERPQAVFLGGLAAAVAGAALMAAATSSVTSPGANPHLGDALSIATAFWYGLYFLAVRQARASRSASQVMTWSSLVGAPILLTFALILGEDLWPSDPVGWAAVAGLGVVHVVGQGAIAWALGRLPASTAAVVVLVQPVAAALLALVLFGEAPTALQALGGALVLAGVALAQARPPRLALAAGSA
jgi:drug/metabolite transporter (DMT)-like permease